MGQREKFLKNTFDSLSGAEQDTKDALAGMTTIFPSAEGGTGLILKLIEQKVAAFLLVRIFGISRFLVTNLP